MGQTLTVDIAWWQAVLGLLGTIGAICGTVAVVLRLWLEPQVRVWIKEGQQDEFDYFDDKLRTVYDELRLCQAGRNECRGATVHGIEATERRLQKAIDDLSGKLDSLSDSLAGVREQIGLLTGRVNGHEKAAR